ncbi:MAG TPA: glycosyltransferase family 4 protein, partial [Terriglobia bacterium]|nr:glycosyltransferase family 4 protein [Terriglobia bacterium]
MGESPNLNILTVNWHTAYLYNLSRTGHRWSVLNKWQDFNRPLPANFQLIDWARARRNFSQFDLAIGHSIWIDVLRILPFCILYQKPYIQVIHGRRCRGGFSRSRFRKFAKLLYARLILKNLVRFGVMRVVFISPYAASDWGLDGTAIDQGIDLAEMGPYEGTEPSLLTVGNTLHREHFAFDELMQIRKQVPVKIVGVNPNIPDCRPSKNWEELRSFYSQNRAYLNLTREPEDGHNLAVLEAMASGMPVISLKHRSTPIRNGENGFLVDDVPEAVDRAKQLLADRELARKLGRSARSTVEQEFSMKEFRKRWNE